MNQDRGRVSALADGALDGEAVARAVGEIGAREDLRQEWQMIHLVGEVLRTGAHAPCTDSHDFVARLRQRMATEAVTRPAPPAASQADVRVVRAEAANEPLFRWKMVAGVASVAAAAAIGWAWMGQGGPGTAPAGFQLAGTTAPVVIGSGAPQVIRDPRLDELLEAHQQAGGGARMLSGFMRNATFEGASR